MFFEYFIYGGLQFALSMAVYYPKLHFTRSNGFVQGAFKFFDLMKEGILRGNAPGAHLRRVQVQVYHIIAARNLGVVFGVGGAH